MNSKITFIKILVFQNFFKKLKVKILDDYMQKTYFPSSCLVLLFTKNNVLQRRDSKFLLGSNYQDTNFTLTLLFDVYTSHYGCNSEALRCIFIPLYRYVHLNLNTQKFSKRFIILSFFMLNLKSFINYSKNNRLQFRQIILQK